LKRYGWHCATRKIFAQLTSGQNKDVSLKQGLSVGAVWLLHAMARQLGIADALGTTQQGKLALWQVIARAIDQGSRLSAVRLAGSHAACDVLGLGSSTKTIFMTISTGLAITRRRLNSG